MVSDPAGAVVPNANVSVRNNRTGTTATATTNETGYYLFPSLPASNYTLTVEAPGFRKAQVENIELNVAVTIRQDVQLEVGSPAESVTVEASAIRVNTSDAQVGRSVTLRDIDTLPQLARNWTPPGGGSVQSFNIVANDPRALGFDPATKKLIDLLPAPNNTDIGDGLNTAGFRFNNPAGFDTHQFTIRSDYNVTSTHRVFYRHSYFKNDFIDALNNADATFPGQPQGTQGGIRWGFSVGSDWAITPSIVNELRVGYQSASVDFRRPARVAGPQVLPNTYTNPILPNFPQGRNSPVIDLTENMTWLKGKHTVKTGVTFKRTLQYGYNAAGIYPNISLSTQFNNVPPLSIGPSGSVISSADRQRFENFYNDVLGRVSSITTTFYSDLQKFQPAGQPRVRNTFFRDYAGFIQDDWKVTRNLTLNVGIRYEIFGAPTERDQLQGTLKQIEQIGYFTQLDNTEIQRSSGSYNTDKNNFAPRIGFAWDPTGTSKWAVRGSWVMFYDRMIGATASLVDGNTPGFAQSVQVFPNSAAGSDVRVRDNRALPAAPPAPQLVLSATRQTSIVVFGPNLRTGYVQHYNFSIQRELMRNTILDVAYVRTRGIKLFNWVDVNQPHVYGNFLESFKEIVNFQRTGAAPLAHQYAGPHLRHSAGGHQPPRRHHRPAATCQYGGQQPGPQQLHALRRRRHLAVLLAELPSVQLGASRHPGRLQLVRLSPDELPPHHGRAEV